MELPLKTMQKLQLVQNAMVYFDLLIVALALIFFRSAIQAAGYLSNSAWHKTRLFVELPLPEGIFPLH